MGSARGEAWPLGCRNVLSQAVLGKRPAKGGLPELRKPQYSAAWGGNKGQGAGGDAGGSSALQDRFA